MNIRIGNYLIKPALNTNFRFDLVEIVTRTKKDSTETYEAESEEGFGMSLDLCLMKIISLNLQRKEGTVSIKEFIEEFKKERDKVLSIINQLNVKL